MEQCRNEAADAAAPSETKKAVGKTKKVARPTAKPTPSPPQAASVQVLDEDDADQPVPAPSTKARKLVPSEPAHPPKQYIDKRPIDNTDEITENEPEQGDAGYDSEVDSELPSSWRKALRRFGVDAHARMQLTLLAEVSYQSASEIVWKLTKERESPIENTSAFIAKCVTSSRKHIHDHGDRSWNW